MAEWRDLSDDEVLARMVQRGWSDDSARWVLALARDDDPQAVGAVREVVDG